MIQFFLPMVPPTVTDQCHKIDTRGPVPRFYRPEDLEQARAKLKAYTAQYRPAEPLDGPLRLVTKWCWPCIKGVTNGTYKHTKPDTDNLIKMLKDVMSELGYWTNDSRVASEITEKFWADKPGIFVQVERLP